MTFEDPSAVAAWMAVLDDMDRGLSQLADQLAAGTTVPAPAPFQPPAGLAPLPRSLAPRVTLLLERTRRVEQEIAERAGAVRTQLEAVDQHHAEQRPVRAAFFDAAF